MWESFPKICTGMSKNRWTEKITRLKYNSLHYRWSDRRATVKSGCMLNYHDNVTAELSPYSVHIHITVFLSTHCFTSWIRVGMEQKFCEGGLGHRWNWTRLCGDGDAGHFVRQPSSKHADTYSQPNDYISWVNYLNDNNELMSGCIAGGGRRTASGTVHMAEQAVWRRSTRVSRSEDTWELTSRLNCCRRRTWTRHRAQNRHSDVGTPLDSRRPRCVNQTNTNMTLIK